MPSVASTQNRTTDYNFDDGCCGKITELFETEAYHLTKPLMEGRGVGWVGDNQCERDGEGGMFVLSLRGVTDFGLIYGVRDKTPIC